jgi:hypothetical protein
MARFEVKGITKIRVLLEVTPTMASTFWLCLCLKALVRHEVKGVTRIRVLLELTLKVLSTF